MNKKNKRLETLRRTGKYLETIDKEIFDLLKVDEYLHVISDHINLKIKKDGYYAFPLSIEVSNFCGNMAPFKSHKLAATDYVSYSLTIFKHNDDIEKMEVKLANSKSMDGSYGKLLNKLKNMTIDAILECKVGAKLSSVRKSLLQETDTPINGVCNEYSMCLYNVNDKKLKPPGKNIPMTKLIIEYEDHGDKIMEEGEIYYIDIYGTNLIDEDVSRHFGSFPTILYMPDFMSNKENRGHFEVAMRELIKNKCLSAKTLYTFMKKTFPYNKYFAMRDLFEEYNRQYNRYPDLDKQLLPLIKYGIIDAVPGRFVEHDYENKIKLAFDYQNQINKLKKQYSIQETDNIKEQINELTTKLDEIKNDDTTVFHYGHTILITYDGYEIIC